MSEIDQLAKRHQGLDAAIPARGPRTIAGSQDLPRLRADPAGETRWESVTLTPVSGIGEHAYDRENRALWERYPQIPPQIWESYYGAEVVVMERGSER